jgi:hypothetical protein
MVLRSFLLVFLAIALAAGAQAQPAPSPAPPPPKPEPYIPAPPPMPDAGVAGDPELEPQVTIIRRATDTVEEVRVGGELRYVKVTPRLGPPYYLVPSGNGQTFLRYDSLDFGLKPPMWLLFSW